MQFRVSLSLVLALFPAMCVTLPHGHGIALFGLVAFIVYQAGSSRFQHGSQDLWRNLMPIALSFLLIFLGVLASVVMNHDHIKALDYPLRWVGLIAVAYCLFRMPFNPRSFWCGVLIGAYGALVLACWQFFIEHFGRAEGFTNAIPFGDISLMLGVFALLRAPYELGKWRVAFLGAFVAGVSASFLSLTRGGWPLLGPLLVYQLTVNPFNISKRVRGGLALLVALVAIVISNSNSIFGERILLVQHDAALHFSGETSTSVAARLTMWRFALQSGLDHFWFGLGPDIYHSSLKQQAISDPLLRDIARFSHAHSEFLDAFAKCGIVGVVTLALFFAIPLTILYRLRVVNSDAACARISAIWLIWGYLIFGLSQVMFAHNISLLFYGVMLIVFWVIAFSGVREVGASQGSYRLGQAAKG